MKRKLCLVLLVVMILATVTGTAYADIGSGAAKPVEPQPGYPLYPDEYYETFGGSADTSITLEIIGDTGLQFLVTETDGVTPIADAAISIVTVQSGALIAAVTDEQGTAFVRLPYPGDTPEKYRFTVKKAGYLPQENIEIEFDGTTIEQHIMLTRAIQKFTLQAVDLAGKPVADAIFSLTHYTMGQVTGEGATDADGKLTLDLPVGRHSYTVKHSKYKVSYGDIECGPEGGTEIVTLRSKMHMARLRIQDKASAKRLPGVKVWLNEKTLMLSNEMGEISFPGGLEQGLHLLLLSKNGYLDIVDFPMNVDERETEQLFIAEMEKDNSKIVNPPTSPPAVATPDPKNIIQGDNQGVNSVVPIQKIRKVSIEACVVNSAGEYLENVKMLLKPEELELKTDQDGRVTFNGALLGKHSITAVKDGVTASMDFEIAASDQVDVIVKDGENKILITDDMESLTLYFELNGKSLRLAGLTDQTVQDDVLAAGVGATLLDKNEVLGKDGVIPNDDSISLKITSPEGIVICLIVVLAVLLSIIWIMVLMYKKRVERLAENT